MSVDQSTVVFRAIHGFPGYRVGSDGSVWSQRTRSGQPSETWRRMSPGTCRGYRFVNLSDGRKKNTRLVHRLVLEAFIGPRPEGTECCHEDNDRSNNALGNLRWDTPAGNTRDKHRHGTVLFGSKIPAAKLTEQAVETMLALREQGWLLKEIGNLFGVTKATVSRIVRGKSWVRMSPACNSSDNTPPAAPADC